MKKTFLLVVFFLYFVTTSSSVVYAQTTSGDSSKNAWSCKQLKADIEKYGGTANRVSDLPAYCNLAEAYTKISSVLYFAVGVIGVLAVTYGGFVYMTARENDTQKRKGKDIILYALLGITISILAIVIVRLVLSVLVDNKFSKSRKM